MTPDAPAWLLSDPLAARLLAAGLDADDAYRICEEAAVLEAEGMPRNTAEMTASGGA